MLFSTTLLAVLLLLREGAGGVGEGATTSVAGDDSSNTFFPTSSSSFSGFSGFCFGGGDGLLGVDMMMLNTILVVLVATIKMNLDK